MKAKTIILVAGIVLGLVYGALSALHNQNPYGHTVNRDAAWHWQPSAVWLPSYLLCKAPRNGLGNLTPTEFVAKIGASPHGGSCKEATYTS